MGGAYRWSGSIQVGPFVQFPVQAKAAIKEQKIAFNTHHGGECGGRLGLGESVCTVCGDSVPKDQVVYGYNGKPGIDRDYLKSLELAKSDLLEVEGFVDAKQIDPRWYQKSYHLTPGKGGEKAYAMLAAVLAKKKKVAIGKTVMGGNEAIVTIRPRNGVLAMELMYWPAEILADDESQYAIEDVKVSTKELSLGETLVDHLSTDFAPEQYVNRLHEAKLEYLDRFLADEAPAPLPVPVRAGKPSSDLASALEASLAALGGEPKKKTRKAAAA